MLRIHAYVYAETLCEFNFAVGGQSAKTAKIIRLENLVIYSMFLIWSLCCHGYAHSQVTPCYFEDGSHDTNVYLLDEMTFGHSVEGPAIIIDKHRWAPNRTSAT